MGNVRVARVIQRIKMVGHAKVKIFPSVLNFDFRGQRHWDGDSSASNLFIQMVEENLIRKYGEERERSP